MGQCGYGKGEKRVEYYEYENKKLIPYECPRDSLPDKHYCKFHDSDYAQTNPDDVMRTFYKLVDEAVQNTKPLFCIGFYLPREVNLTNKEFKDRVYFSHTTFTKEADFYRAAFNNAVDFKRAAFNNAVDFKRAAFNNAVDFKRAAFNNAVDFKRAAFNNAVDFKRAAFNNAVDFKRAAFNNAVDFYRAAFNNAVDFYRAAFNNTANFTRSDFINEVWFDKSRFPSPKADKDFKDNTICIKFDYCKFRKLMQFIGDPSTPLELGLVSLKGVNLSNVEFHNVKWLKTKNLFFSRYMIIDEALLGKGKNTNYEDVSKIYNQLRKNYESKLLFNEASNFFIGEMEAIKKSLWNGTRREKMASIPYSLYKALALYGESYFLPLVIWTPALIGLFIAWRFITGECSLQSVSNVISPHITQTCSPKDFFIDSFAAYFQFPRSTINPVDTIERIMSIPILGTAFIAIRRKFERIK